MRETAAVLSVADRAASLCASHTERINQVGAAVFSTGTCYLVSLP